MGWFILTHLFSALVAFVSIGRLLEREKDIEILLVSKYPFCLAIAIKQYPQPQLRR